MFDPDGDQAAADNTRSSATLDTGSSVNPRTARRLMTASYTSMIAFLDISFAVESVVDDMTPGRRRCEDTENENERRPVVMVCARCQQAGRFYKRRGECQNARVGIHRSLSAIYRVRWRMRRLGQGGYST